MVKAVLSYFFSLFGVGGKEGEAKGFIKEYVRTLPKFLIIV